MELTQETESTHERFRDLMKRKKKLLTKIRRNKKEAIKARIEKAKINEELRTLKGKHNIFANMDADAACADVKKRIEAVSPEEIYPRDLERRFDSIDKPNPEHSKVLDLGRVVESPIATARRDEDDHIVGDSADYGGGSSEAEEGVIDLSDE